MILEEKYTLSNAVDIPKAGKLRAIGLSNFEKADIDNILHSCLVKPMVTGVWSCINL